MRMKYLCQFFWFHPVSSSTSGSTKHNLTITAQDDGKSPTVKDLSDALTQATGVPAASQKLIFKGKLQVSEESVVYHLLQT